MSPHKQKSALSSVLVALDSGMNSEPEMSLHWRRRPQVGGRSGGAARPAFAGENGTNEATPAAKVEKDLVKEISVDGGMVQRWEPRSVKNISSKIWFFLYIHQIKSVAYIFLGFVCHNLCEFPAHIYFFAILVILLWGDIK